MRRLANYQKTYAWGILALGALPVAVLLFDRMLYKDDPTYTFSELFADLVLMAALTVIDVILIACAISAAATALSARFVSRGSHPIFCKAVAVLNLLYFPFGTVLGLMTLRTLARQRAVGPEPR
jgi:hypothetical protein